MSGRGRGRRRRKRAERKRGRWCSVRGRQEVTKMSKRKGKGAMVGGERGAEAGRSVGSILAGASEEKAFELYEL